MPVLLALFGPKRGVRLEVEERATLGRSSEADLQLLDEKVSRLHCRFTATPDGRLEVEDLGSNNGTYVNGERLSSARPLAAGDEIAVGDSLFVVDDGGDAAAARFGDATLIVAPGERPGALAAQAPAVPAPAASALAATDALLGALGRCGNLEAAARAVLAAMESAFAPKRAFVLLWDATGGLARPLVGRAEDKVVAVSRTVLELAARQRRAVAVEDAVTDRALRDARSVARHQIRAVAVAPVLVDGEVVGFLHVDRDRPAYGAEQAALLGCFAAAFALGGHLRPAAGPPSTDGEVGPDGGPIGGSAAWRAALRAAEASAATTSTVLITGESGTGKEEIAKHVHRRSRRASGPFVVVNCGAIPEALAESELFGHERGAFTGAATTRVGSIEAADGGTLFLDEVGELPPSLQVKLLRVLQERVLVRVGSSVPRRVDLRVVAATHRDLASEVRAGRFREDLFYRLAVIRIHLPPLRDRREDVEPLSRALLARIAAGLGRRDPGLDDGALERLRAWRWPGNVRELGNVLERALVLRLSERRGALDAEEIAAAIGESPPLEDETKEEKLADAEEGPGRLADRVAALERTEITAALQRARGVKSRAAEALGLSRPTLDKKMADLGIDLWRSKR